MILKSAPAGYRDAFLFTETDDNDLNYFILHQLRVIRKSLEALERYIENKRNGNLAKRPTSRLTKTCHQTFPETAPQP